jgi:hypothetical protein
LVAAVTSHVEQMTAGIPRLRDASAEEKTRSVDRNRRRTDESENAAHTARHAWINVSRRSRHWTGPAGERGERWGTRRLPE